MALQAGLAARAPSDASESIPIANRKSTIFGVIISLQIVAFIAVVLRLYSRIKLIKKPWWDDAAIAIAFVTVTFGTVFIAMCVECGLGQHVMDLPSPNSFPEYLKRFYAANGSYTLSTTFIKLSLLLQYLRVYESGRVRRICIFLVWLISLWGLAYSFMAWFPCFPVQAFWDWSITDARCYAYGARSKGPFFAAYVGHSSTNFFFDLAVLLCALPMFSRNDRSRREIIALSGLLSVGIWIIAVSAWRLGTIIEHRAGWGKDGESMDFTWYAPISILLSAVEVATAIFAASMPVFWPMLEARLLGVVVTHEINVTEQRESGEHGLELHRTSTHSVGGSEIGLNRARAAEYYGSRYLQGYLDPFKTMDKTTVTQVGHIPRLPQSRGKAYEALGIEYK